MQNKKLTFADLAKMGQEQVDPLSGMKKTEDARLLADMFGVPQVQDMESIPAQQHRGLTRSELEKQAPENLKNKIASSTFITDMIKNNTAVLDKSKLSATIDTAIPVSLQYPDSSIPDAKTQSDIVPPAASPAASISKVQSNSQDTQTPEQKLVTQSAADSQNPLADTQMQQALAEAKEKAETNQRRKGLFEMMAGIGSLGGSEMSAESESLDNAIKMQNAPVDQINEQRAGEQKFLALKEERDSQDVNSETSKFYAETLENASPALKGKLVGKKSRSDMEKAYPQIFAAIQAKERAEDRDLTRQQMAQNKQLAFDQKASDKQNSYLQFATTKSSGLREGYAKIQTANNLVKDATGTPEQQLTALYSIVSSLDPNSAVREGEIGLASQIASLKGNVIKHFNRIEKGGVMDPETFAKIRSEISRIAGHQKNSYDQQMSVFKAGAKNRGIGEDRYNEFDPYGSSQSSETAQPKTAAPSVGSIIKSNGKRYKVTNSAGDLEEIK